MSAGTFAFDDPISGCSVVLHVDGTKSAFDGLTVEHAGSGPDGLCPTRADVSADLDAFFCPTCRWNGRISGAWAFDLWEAARA